MWAADGPGDYLRRSRVMETCEERTVRGDCFKNVNNLGFVNNMYSKELEFFTVNNLIALSVT